jgi:hypothetical protein
VGIAYGGADDIELVMTAWPIVGFSCSIEVRKCALLKERWSEGPAG